MTTDSTILPSPLTFERWVYPLREQTWNPGFVRAVLEGMPGVLPPNEFAFFEWMCEDLTLSPDTVLVWALQHRGWVSSMRRHYLIAVPSQKPTFASLDQWIEAERKAWGPTGKSVIHWVDTCETIEPECFSPAMLPRYVPAREIELVQYTAESDKCSPRDVLQKFFQYPANLRMSRSIKEVGEFERARNEDSDEGTETVTVRVSLCAVGVLRDAAQRMDVSFDEYVAGALRQEARRLAQL